MGIEGSFEKAVNYSGRKSQRILKDVDSAQQEIDQQHAWSDDASVRGSTKRKKKKSGRKQLRRKKSKQRVKHQVAIRSSQHQSYSDDESVRMGSHGKPKKFSQKQFRK